MHDVTKLLAYPAREGESMPEEKTFDVRALAKRPVGDPVPVYGDETITCAHFYNSLWEACLADESVMLIDKDKYDAIIAPLYDYLTAMLFVRWSLSADVDMEEELEKKVFDILDNADMSNIDFNIWQGEFSSDHNDDAFVFNKEDRLGAWLGECLSSTAMSLSGFGYKSSDIFEDDLVWMSGQSPYHPSRPCFKERGWQLARDMIESQFSIVKYSLTDHVLDITLIDINACVNRNDMGDDELWWDKITANDVRKHSGENDCAIAIVPKGNTSGYCGNNLVMFLYKLGILDGKYKTIMAIESSADDFSKDKLSALVGSLDMDVLVDGVFGKNSSFTCVYGDELFYKDGDTLGTTPWDHINGWCYLGKVPEQVIEKIDETLSQISVEKLVNIVCRPTKTEREAAKSESNKSNAADWSYSVQNKLALTYGSKVSHALTFGRVDISMPEDIIDIQDGSVYMSYRKMLEAAGKTSIAPLPKYDMISAAVQLLEREEELSPDPEIWMETYIPDNAPIDDALCQKFEERLAHVVEIAEAAGIPSAFDALDAGVPIEDILA